MLDPILDRGRFREKASVFHLPHLAFVELFQDCEELSGATKLFKNLPEPISSDYIETVSKAFVRFIDCIEAHMLLSTFVLDLSQDEDHVCCSLVCSVCMYSQCSLILLSSIVFSEQFQWLGDLTLLLNQRRLSLKWHL